MAMHVVASPLLALPQPILSLLPLLFAASCMYSLESMHMAWERML